MSLSHVPCTHKEVFTGPRYIGPHNPGPTLIGPLFRAHSHGSFVQGPLSWALCSGPPIQGSLFRPPNPGPMIQCPLSWALYSGPTFISPLFRAHSHGPFLQGPLSWAPVSWALLSWAPLSWAPSPGPLCLIDHLACLWPVPQSWCHVYFCPVLMSGICAGRGFCTIVYLQNCRELCNPHHDLGR